MLTQAGGKGWGIRATARIPKGTFVVEYVGEVLDAEELEDRAELYVNDKHFYFLTLDASECIDARKKGNWARFINHSCDPNCLTQKWMVNGEIRIGIFAMRDVLEGEELTFDYQFERFGSKKQKCLCGSANCCQWIGGKIEKPREPTVRAATPFCAHLACLILTPLPAGAGGKDQDTIDSAADTYVVFVRRAGAPQKSASTRCFV